ncbi:hypothetical protein LCGC14_1991960 [marine sediment metagenome]|uniref:Uncharacterized protein n=1 Tax=marine sediment metagenome TaxID=412755 RepID=A0A0F9FTV5_9ZZZZ
MDNITRVIIQQGVALRVEIEGTDGAVEFHYDTAQYPGRMVIVDPEKTTMDKHMRMPEKNNGILYDEDFTAVEDGDEEKVSVDDDPLAGLGAENLPTVPFGLIKSVSDLIE